jgi:hypothetical protein
LAIDDLPLPVVNFLNLIGVEWPYINEDTVTQFATLVREFGQAVEQTHQDATDAVSRIAQAHQGASTQALQSGWAKLSATHVTEIVDGCQVLADALDGWAAYIVVQKGEAVGEMIGMAAAFFADQAAAPETLGASEALMPIIVAGAKKLAESLVEDLNQYVEGKVIEAAAKPLFAKIESALTGLDWPNSGASADEAQGFSLDLQALEAQTQVLAAHGAAMRAHAAKLSTGISGLSF